MCLLWDTNCVFISQRTTFFTVTAVITSDPTYLQTNQISERKSTSKEDNSQVAASDVWCEEPDSRSRALRNYIARLSALYRDRHSASVITPMNNHLAGSILTDF
jgi:hypothetical protein